MLLENFPYPDDPRVSREARALVGAGHEVTVIAPRAPGQPRREIVAGVRVGRFWHPKTGSSGAGVLAEYLIAVCALHLAAIGQLVRGATVLHLHNPPDLLFPAGLVARALGRRVVFDHHDLFPELVEEKIGPGPAVRAARLAERATFAVSTHVLAANESHAHVARERGQLPAERVSVVRNGPPRDSIADAVRVRPGALEDPELVYVGALASQDGVVVLAELLASLQRDHGLPGARLTVVGDGEERRALELALAAAGVAASAQITGWVPAHVVREHLAAADICVDPSPPTKLNQQSTMIKIGEYLAAGKPVVAYDLLETARTAGAAARLVVPGDLEAMASAVAELARDPEAREQLARAALERAPALAWERSAEVLLDVYSRL
jgi:glycosyltransferase involved in cell wall biosynthesis